MRQLKRELWPHRVVYAKDETNSEFPDVEAWLRKIYKRRFWQVWGTGFHMEPEVEYADIFYILANPD